MAARPWQEADKSASRFSNCMSARKSPSRRRARFRIQAESRGLEAEQADNFVYGRLRDMALPSSRFGTGRNRRSETQLSDDSTA